MSYGELLLVVGDLHIPQRSSGIPHKFKSMLVPDKMQRVVSCGNLCSSEQLNFLKKIAPTQHIVRGDCDDASLSLPEEVVFQVGEFRIGVIHGHQIIPNFNHESLNVYAKRLDCDIFITGHSHKHETYEYDGKWFVNPGSITGAVVGRNGGAVRPSFICMSIQGQTATCFIYELNALGEVDVMKSKFVKSASSSISNMGSSIVNTAQIFSDMIINEEEEKKPEEKKGKKNKNNQQQQQQEVENDNLLISISPPPIKEEEQNNQTSENVVVVEEEINNNKQEQKTSEGERWDDV